MGKTSLSPEYNESTIITRIALNSVDLFRTTTPIYIFEYREKKYCIRIARVHDFASIIKVTESSDNNSMQIRQRS